MKPDKDLKISNLKVGDKIRYSYRGFSVAWIGNKEGEVIKINSKTIKIKVVYNNEILTFNVNPLELRKL